MLLEFNKPIPVVIIKTKKEGYAIYVESGGQFENDIWCIVLCDGGNILHCTTDQLLVHKNSTFGINEKEAH